MRTIYKFPLGVKHFTVISMPKGAEILTVQMQFGDLCLWAIVDPEAEDEDRQFYIFPTGRPLNLPEYEYIGTVQMRGGQLVWHVFEIKSNHVIE